MTKKCSLCGFSHTRDTWLALRHVGIQRDMEGTPELELRLCVCGSTMAVPIAIMHALGAKP